MPTGERVWTDEVVERYVGMLLRSGVVLSALVVLGGGILYLAKHGEDTADLRSFHGEPAALRSPVAILNDALTGHAAGVIQLGLLLLIATPVARVLFSAFAFLRERDYLYAGITAMVLAILVYALITGDG